MKIICTEREKEHLLGIFRVMADTSKMYSLSCPFGFLHCAYTPLGDIKPDSLLNGLLMITSKITQTYLPNSLVVN